MNYKSRSKEANRGSRKKARKVNYKHNSTLKRGKAPITVKVGGAATTETVKQVTAELAQIGVPANVVLVK